MIVDSVYIEITNQCNLSCSYCYNSSNNKLKTDELKIEDINRIIEFFITLGAKNFSFSGGEPSLHSNYAKLFDIINTHSNVAFVIITNGTKYYEKIYSKAKKMKNLTFQVSLDGANEATNMKTRGKGSFDLTINTISKLSNSINRVALKMVVSKHNQDNIDDFVILSKEYNCIPTIAFVNKIGRAENIWDDITLSYKEKDDINKKLNEYYLNEEILFEENSSGSGCPLSDYEKKPQSILIKANGEIQPCQLLYDSKFSLGNVLNYSITEIEKNAKKIEEIAFKRTKLTFDCDKCINRSECFKGCMAVAYNSFGDCLANDGECEKRRLDTAQAFMSEFMRKDSSVN